jgi:hypothetical protein
MRTDRRRCDRSRMRPLSPGQCRVHETGINMLCEYRLQSGKRIGTQRLAMFDTSVVDGLFGKLLFKEVNGEKRRTTVNHSMKTARTAWNAVGRSHPKLVPPRNPFEKMGLQPTSRKTPDTNSRSLWPSAPRRSKWGVGRWRPVR